MPRREPRDTDEADDSNTPGIAAFNKIHSRQSTNGGRIGAAVGGAVGAAAGGGLGGALAEAVLTPIASAAGEKIGKTLFGDKDEDDD
jgi:hypothetical protein